jgi:hypothetical protein
MGGERDGDFTDKFNHRGLEWWFLKLWSRLIVFNPYNHLTYFSKIEVSPPTKAKANSN